MPAEKRLLYSALDSLVLLFALTVSVTIGTQFQPEPISFLGIFLLGRFLVYWFLARRSQQVKFSILKLGVHSLILIAILPILFALGGFLLPSLSDILFLFVLIPTIGLVTSFLLHRYYSLS